MAVIDPTLYGGRPLDPSETLQDIPQVQAGDVPAVEAPQIPADAFVFGPQSAQAGANIRASSGREEAPMLAQVGAAMSLWDTANVYERVTSPTFTPDVGFQPSVALQQVPYQLTADEFDFMNKSRSTSEWEYRLGRVQDIRFAQETVGDSPFVNMLVQVMDPVYIGTGGASAFMKTRTAAAALAGGGAGAVSLTAAGAAPKSDTEIALNVMLNAAAGTFVAKQGRLVKRDPDFPDEALREATVRSAPGVATAEDAQKLVDNHLGQTLGEKLQWNMRKTMAGFGDVGKKISDTFFDNNSDLSLTSVEAQRAAVRADLSAAQSVFEDGVRKAMAEDGYGMLRSLWDTKGAYAHQRSIERQVKQELMRREQLSRQGLPIADSTVPKRITEMANSYDRITQLALKELKAAGVQGAEQVIERAGWFHRNWDAAAIEGAISKIATKSGKTSVQAQKELVKMVAMSLRRANGWDNELSKDIAGSIISRALRKGHFEDSVFNLSPGEGTLKQMRDLLREEGLSGARLERAMKVLEGNVDEQAKAAFLKHRVDLDYKAGLAVDGEIIGINDLIDSNLTRITDRYLDSVAGQVAFARKGFKAETDVMKLRDELIADIADEGTRGKAVKLFDDAVNYMYGRPVGGEMNDTLRNMGMYGRMIALANSGLWQFTEYATIMAKYGAAKTIKHAIAEMPGFKSLMDTAFKDKRTSQHLKDVLTRHSSQNLRLRPFLDKFEDNYTMSVSNSMSLKLQQAQQLVPYFNAMKYVHNHQARVTSNLILDRIQQAAGGSMKARKLLEKYGVEQHVMDKIAADIKVGGWEVDKWSAGTWDAVRPAFAKMMDEGVLHQRLGDMPAFAVFDPVGKFIFTYRSFVLSAHNKVLSGSLGRDGLGGVGLLLTYQLPLAAMAVAAQHGLQGKELKEDELFAKAIGQMGGLGLFAEIAGVMSGTKQQFGAPGLIPIDRAISVVGDTAQGKFTQAGAGALGMVPLFGLLQPIRSLEHLSKE